MFISSYLRKRVYLCSYNLGQSLECYKCRYDNMDKAKDCALVKDCNEAGTCEVVTCRSNFDTCYEARGSMLFVF